MSLRALPKVLPKRLLVAAALLDVAGPGLVFDPSIYDGGTLTAYTGAAANDAGDVLGAGTLPARAFRNAIEDVRQKNGSWSITATKNGVIRGLLITSADETENVWLTVTEAGGGGDIIIDNDDVQIGDSLELPTLAWTMPEEVPGGDPGDPPPGGGTVLATHDFENGSIAPFFNPWGVQVGVVDDPTPRATGKVARIQYIVTSGSGEDKALAYVHPSHLRYNQTVDVSLSIFLPAAGGAWNGAHNRKLIDYQGYAVRMTLHRVGVGRDLRLSIVDGSSGAEDERFDVSTGIALADDTWHRIRVVMRTNSANGVADGRLDIYMNGATTPTYSRTTGLQWITEAVGSGSYFDTFLFGFQLTIDSGDPDYSEYRYIDDLEIRLG